jgi:hypothetical protein
MKARNRAGLVAIAAAVLVGGSAIGVVAIAATPSHPAAQPASFSARLSHHASEWTQLDSVISDWNSSPSTSLGTLAGMTQQTLSQTTAHHKTLDIQRGIVVLATSRFLILKSSDGSLHLWILSGRTTFDNVSASMAGTQALTASRSAAQQAVLSGDMFPAVSEMAGSSLVAAQMLTPSAAPQTVTIVIAGTDLTVTVTVTRNTATVSQTATTPAFGMPYRDPMTTSQSAWATVSSTTMLARGDLAVVAGTRSHGVLNAEIVLYAPLSASGLFRGSHPGAAATASPSPSPSPSSTEVGTHW